jgi:hypothetical protein
MMKKYRPKYLTADLRRCRYQVAISSGLPIHLAERIKDWTRPKFIEYIYNWRIGKVVG